MRNGGVQQSIVEDDKAEMEQKGNGNRESGEMEKRKASLRFWTGIIRLCQLTDGHTGKLNKTDTVLLFVCLLTPPK